MPGDVVDKPATLAELAREAVEETATLDEAARALLRKVRGDRDLISQMLKHAASDLTRKVRVERRASMENEYFVESRDRGIRRHVAAMAARLSIYDWQLPVTGKSIGDATADDLGAAVTYHVRRSEFEAGRVYMYSAVLQRLRRTNAATVREGIKERDLANLMKEAEPDA